MKLIEQAAGRGFQYKLLQGDENPEISALCYDTRKVTPGCLFVCLKGANFDSHSAVGEVAEKGAAAIVVSEDVALPEGVSVFKTEDSREALSRLSAAWFGFPGEKLLTVGITGTKGKTTTAHMVRAVLEAGGIPCGLIGTNGIAFGKDVIPTKNTTPESYEIQEAFAKMAEAGMKAVVMEVSSQGLMLHRTGGIRFDLGIFTNLSPDHIGPNEHKSFEEYRMWKTTLFRQCRMALINRDSPYADDFLAAAGSCERVLTYGETDKADVALTSLRYVSEEGLIGLNLQVRLGEGHEISSVVGIPGRFNADNALAAISAGYLLGVGDEALSTGLRNIRVNGRMEILMVSPFTVLVDYAHNAVSMESLLDTLREYQPKKLTVVFGCGGNRAKDRRYSMGEIAGKKADFSIITADNSRYERVEDIMEDIRSHLAPTGGKYIEIADRREAIFHAVREAVPGEIVAIIGKGHEDYQEINGVRHHFLDREVAEEALKACGY